MRLREMMRRATRLRPNAKPEEAIPAMWPRSPFGRARDRWALLASILRFLENFDSDTHLRLRLALKIVASAR